MDEEIDRSKYLKKNHDFFNNYTFKFEGLSPEGSRGFTYIIKSFGGEVSNEAKYTFAEKYYLQKTKNKERKDLYHLNFILDSIDIGTILNIELYRCDRICSIENGNNSARNNSSIKSSSDDDSLMTEITNQLKSKNNEKKYNSKAISVNSKCDGKSDSESSFSNEFIKIKVESNLSDFEDDFDFPSSSTNKPENIKCEVFTSRSESSSDDEDELMTGKRKKKDSDLTINLQKNGVSQNKTEDVKTSLITNKNLKNNSDEKNSKKIKLEKNSAWTESRIEDRDDLKWLFELNEDDLCRMKKCKFEPGPHERHSEAGRVISYEEKKVILRYLIRNNLVLKAKGSTAWRLMNEDGYLIHRSPETLRNCLRRIIIPNISKFSLPNDIMQQFLAIQRR